MHYRSFGAYRGGRSEEGREQKCIKKKLQSRLGLISECIRSVDKQEWLKPGRVNRLLEKADLGFRILRFVQDSGSNAMRGLRRY